MIKLTQEQVEEVAKHPEGVTCIADGIDGEFIILAADVLQQLQDAINKSDRVAIESGLKDVEAGRMQPADIAHQHGRDELISRFQ